MGIRRRRGRGGGRRCVCEWFFFLFFSSLVFNSGWLTRGLFLFVRPRRLSKEDASRAEQLVPIRLEFDVDHNRMRDTFVWNLNGTSG